MPVVHRRQLIRDLVVEALTTKIGDPLDWPTRAQGRVAAERTTPWQPEELPAISVTTPREDVDRDSAMTAPRVLDVELQLVIDAGLRVSAGLAAERDAFALEIERVMEKLLQEPDPFGGLVTLAIYVATDSARATEADREIGIARMTYGIRYRKAVPEEPLELVDLEKIRLRYNLNGEQAPADQAEDHVTLEPPP